MKYYSEKLNKVFDTEQELFEAEKQDSPEKEEKDTSVKITKGDADGDGLSETSEKARERRAAARDIEDMYRGIMRQHEDLIREQEELQEMIDQFIEQYGVFHLSLRRPFRSMTFDPFSIFSKFLGM